jgi:hypothetical protein
MDGAEKKRTWALLLLLLALIRVPFLVICLFIASELLGSSTAKLFIRQMDKCIRLFF